MLFFVPLLSGRPAYEAKTYVTMWPTFIHAHDPDWSQRFATSGRHTSWLPKGGALYIATPYRLVNIYRRFKMLDSECECDCTVIPRNVGKSLPIYTASNPRRLVPSATTLRGPHISYCFIVVPTALNTIFMSINAVPSRALTRALR